MKISVSILSSSINAADIVKKLDNTEADYIHVDIMDGKFVENKTWTFSEMKKITSYSRLPLDVHLMVENPKKYIEDYAMLNTDTITFHYEAVKDIDEMIEYVKNYGLKVGLAINPDTPANVLFPYLGKIDEIIVMSVYPGKSGQSFIYESLDKIKELRTEIDNKGYRCVINVDGGVNDETAPLCKEAGVDMLVSASFIHKDIKNNIKLLKNI